MHLAQEAEKFPGPKPAPIRRVSDEAAGAQHRSPILVHQFECGRRVDTPSRSTFVSCMLCEKHEEERPVLLHKFISSSGHIATTSDGSGGNLPKEDGPWQQFASQVVNADDTPNVGTSSLDILADVKADGFSLFPRKKA